MITEEHELQEQSKPAWYGRPIKTVSIEQIERAFSKAMGELTGTAYDVTISKLDLNPYRNSFLSDSSYIELSLSRPDTVDDNNPF